MAQVCNNIGLPCYVCFPLQLTLSTVMTVAAGLTPAAIYYLWITDKFGNQYKDIVTIAAGGSFDIVAANFPEGMFITSASFDCFLADTNGANIQSIVFDGTAYDCFILSTIR